MAQYPIFTNLIYCKNNRILKNGWIFSFLTLLGVSFVADSSYADIASRFCTNKGGKVKEYLIREASGNMKPVELCWIGDGALGTWTLYNFFHVTAPAGIEGIQEFLEHNNLTLDAINAFLLNPRSPEEEERQRNKALEELRAQFQANAERKEEGPFGDEHQDDSPTSLAANTDDTQNTTSDQSGEAQASDSDDDSAEVADGAEKKEETENEDLGDAFKRAVNQKLADQSAASRMVTQIVNQSFQYCVKMGGNPYKLHFVTPPPPKEDGVITDRSESPYPKVVCYFENNSAIETWTLFYGPEDKKTAALTKVLLSIEDEAPYEEK